MSDNKPRIKGKGRRKIPFKKIQDPSKRNITFAKRSKGVVKKLAELAILCDAEFAFYIRNSSNDSSYIGKSGNLKLGEFFEYFIANLPKINAKGDKSPEEIQGGSD